MKYHLVVIYHSYSDPLFEGLMLKYLQKFQENEQNHKFFVITFEQAEYSMEKGSIEKLKESLLVNYSIDWKPLKYHSGGAFLLFKKIWDLILVLITTIKIRKLHTLHRIIGFTTISGSISYFISKIFRVPLVLINIEPHSDYMSDFGYWKKNSAAYRILKYLEKKQMQKAMYLAVPTQNAYNLLSKDPKINNHLYFVPTCINTDDFSYDEKSREIGRKRIGVTDSTKVLVYIGKFEGIYYSIAQMVQIFKRMDPFKNDLFFYIITGNRQTEIYESFKEHDLHDRIYVQGSIKYEEISDHLSVGDLGVLFIPSYPSQLFRCPVKTANYLACGIPYLITPNIGDDSRLATELNLGLVLKDVDNQNIRDLLTNNKFDRNSLRQAVNKLRDIKMVLRYLSMSLN